MLGVTFNNYDVGRILFVLPFTTSFCSTTRPLTCISEYVAGLSPARIVQCHGGFRTASCIKCHQPCPSAWYRDEIEAGRIPRCTRRYSPNRSEGGKTCGGLCKPDITFFGEGLSAEFKERKKQARVIYLLCGWPLTGVLTM